MPPAKFSISNKQAELLIKKYSWIVCSLIKKICKDPSYYDDFEALGNEKLVVCKQQFKNDHNSGCEFATYAYKGIKNAFLQRSSKYMKISKKEVLISPNKDDGYSDINNYTASSGDGSFIMEEIEARPEKPVIDMLDVIDKSPIINRDKDILRMRIEGKSLKFVGKAFDLSPEGIRQIQLRAKKHLDIEQ